MPAYDTANIPTGSRCPPVGAEWGSAVAITNELSERVLDTFVELADTLASGYEVGEFLQILVHRCSDLLVADTAGVLLESPGDGTPAMAVATSQDMLEIERLEDSVQQGTCLEAYRTGEQVVVDDLTRWRDRWPDFVPRILDLGMRSSAGFPLRLRDDCIGALNLYRREPQAFADHEMRLGQALADIAAVGILQERAVFNADRRAEQLQRALDSRVLIEQAKGVLGERHGVPPGAAFEVLRRYARNNNRMLRDVCRRVVDGELDL